MISKKLGVGIVFVFMSSLCSSLGQLVWKLMSLNNLPLYHYFFGLVLYGFGALLLITAFKFGDMSVLHPMLSCGFVLAIVWSITILDEHITSQKFFGTVLITAGVVFLAVGNKNLN
jgi:undecaprenyl phosphate-alpha-L-ara4N flippase subunit ArnE